jgi:hypothetical protein
MSVRMPSAASAQASAAATAKLPKDQDPRHPPLRQENML